MFSIHASISLFCWTKFVIVSFISLTRPIQGSLCAACVVCLSSLILYFVDILYSTSTQMSSHLVLFSHNRAFSIPTYMMCKLSDEIESFKGNKSNILPLCVCLWDRIFLEATINSQTGKTLHLLMGHIQLIDSWTRNSCSWDKFMRFLVPFIEGNNHRMAVKGRVQGM